MEFEINIGPYKLFKRTPYSKLQVVTKDNVIVTDTTAGKKLLEDYKEQTSFPEDYFDMHDGILYDFNRENKSTYIFLPENLTHISHSAFASTYIHYIYLPASLFFMGQSVFKNCCNLGKIKIPKLIKRIEDNTFDGCVNLKDIELPNELLMLDKYSFYGCVGLKKIEIPDTVRKIGDYAFCGCTCIKEINIPRDFENFGNMPFLNSGIETIRFNHNLSRRNPAEYKEALKYTKINKVIIGSDVQFLDFQIFKPIKNQIKEIKYEGTFEEFKAFASKNPVLTSGLSEKKILSNDGFEGVIKNNGGIPTPEINREIVENER